MVVRTSLILITLLALGAMVLTEAMHANEPPAVATSPNCPPTWYTSPSPSGPNADEYLSSVDAVSANVAWAVGRHRTIQYWNAGQWVQGTGPDIGDDYNLNRVEVIASNNVWAVGETASGASVVLRWNGILWSTFPIPNFGRLNDLAAIGADDVWVTADHALMHWNGMGWTTYMPPTGAAVYGIDGATANDVWAATSSEAIHWNGSSWTAFPVPSPPPPIIVASRTLTDVTVLPGGEAWIVGEWINYDPKPLQPEGGPGYKHSLVAHWAGSQWQYVDTGQGISAGLTQVDALSPNDVWAVGNSGRVYGYDYVQRILHWNGSQWMDFWAQPHNVLTGAAIAREDNVWAVGAVADAQGATRTLIRRYADPCLYPPPPTVTPKPPSPTAPPSATPTITPTSNPPRCPGERFTDVCPGDYFYQHVLELNALGVVAGYNSSPPCESQAHVPCFKPYNNTTRGQISKVVSLAAGFSEPVSGQTFADVPPTHTFYTYTEQMAARGIIVGYPCGSSPSEPCIPPDNRPFFRPGGWVSRGQLTKMVSLAFDFNEATVGQMFEDVPPDHTFYTYTQRLAQRQIIVGYPCGNPEPCVPPNNRPYFRLGSNVTRGQIAKIVNLARIQPGATTTPTTTASPTTVESPSTTPTCCTDVTGSITASCRGHPYHVSYTITNSCPYP